MVRLDESAHQPSAVEEALQGYAFKQAEQWDPAQASFQRALALEPEWGEVLIELGELYFKLNRSEEGLALWLRASVLTPEWGEDLRDPTQMEAAVDRWQKYTIFPLDYPDVLVKIAEALIGEHRFEEAMALWEHLFPLCPEAAFTHRRITAAMLFCGRVAFADRIFQARVDRNNARARERQLDRLGLRFLRDFSTHVGHIGLLDQYLKMDRLGLRAAARPVLVTGLKPVGNAAYLDCWRPHLPDMITDPATYLRLAPLVDELEDHTHGIMDRQGGQRISYNWGDFVQVLRQWDAEKRPPLLSLSEAQHARGQACLRQLGVPEGAWFVGLHIREDAWDKVRNASTQSYQLAIDTILKRGGWVIRMGDAAMTPLPPSPRVLDYALGPHKSDWMDVYLWATCRFFLGTQSGPVQVPPTFGLPCVLTNWAPPLAPLGYEQDLCIFKRYYSEREQRFLTFQELLSSPIGCISASAYLDTQGIALVDNTAEEINAVVLEMLDRLEGRPQSVNEAHQKAWREAYEPLGGTNGRLGRAFAEDHAYLLGFSSPA